MSFPFFEVETSSADPVVVGEVVVTPRAQSLTLMFPGVRGGLVWSRPVSVLVQRQSGTVQRQHIVDVTRLWEFVLAGIGLALFVVLSIAQRRLNRGR